jgi:acetylornithine/N-succinyldiaminopimelate aminotransferase
MANEETSEIIQRHEDFMTLNYPRYPVAMVRGQGSFLWDAEGNHYLDLFAGFGAGLLGHAHRELVEAITEQASKLWHPGNLFHSEPQTKAAELISRLGFGGRSFFCHSGADANEAAIKLARLYGKANPSPDGESRFQIVTALNSFHGRTLGTMVATAQPKVREGFDPFLPGFVHIPFNDLDAAQQAIGPNTAAVMVEPIQGEGGLIVADDDYLPTLRRICDEHDVLLIVDEVWTGCGRTGKYFAYQHWDIEPDIMTLAKGVGGGLPVGVMCAKDDVAKYYDFKVHGGVAHATTLGGNCLAMAATAKILEILERDQIADQTAALGRSMIDRMKLFAEQCPIVTDVRGKGLFVGIELDPDAEGAWFDHPSQIVQRCMDGGVLINATRDRVLRLAPSLLISLQEMDAGLEVLERAIQGLAIRSSGV